jgi:hypothetical protein
MGRTKGALNLTCTDAVGNSSSTTALVTVLHDQR